MTNEILMLAQSDPIPPVPGDSPPATGQPGATGATGTGGSPAGAFGPDFLLIFVLIIVGLLVFSIMGQRRDRKKREAMLSAVKKHDRVQTVGGVIGSVVDVKADQVVLKVDESSNTRITFSRTAVQQVLNSESVAPGPSLGEKN